MKETKKIEAVDSLAVKYRPRTIDDIVGNQDSIDVLRGMFTERKVPRTFLFSGPTGAGKTTTARIFAMTLNCQDLQGINPCLKCRSCKSALNGSHPDIYELNAAGEDGTVSTIRDTISLTKLVPTYNKKIVIIDEAHGLTGKSKNEILKPIEEPPPNTIWILCSMNPEKLDKAIYGRCVKLFFNYPLEEDISKLLRKITKREFPMYIQEILKKHLPMIASGCVCQPRNSIATLEKIANVLLGKKSKKINEEVIEKLIKKYVVVAGDLDAYAIKFLMHSYYGKKLLPLEILSNIDAIRSEEFISLILRYSHYATMWILNKDSNKKMNRAGFYGLDFIRWDAALNKAGKHVTAEKALAMCSSATTAIEKIRLGLMPPYYGMLFMFQNFLEKVKLNGN